MPNTCNKCQLKTARISVSDRKVISRHGSTNEQDYDSRHTGINEGKDETGVLVLCSLTISSMSFKNFHCVIN